MAMKAGALFEPSYVHFMSTQLCIVRGVSVVPLTLFLEGLLVPGQIRIELTLFRIACLFG